MTTFREKPGMVLLAGITFLLFIFLYEPAAVRAETSVPVINSAEVTKAAELLEMGRKVEKALTVGELHLYSMNLQAGQKATVKIEKQGVAVVATIFSPNGKKIGTFGSIASSRGTQPITFVTEDAGSYRMSVSTFFKQASPGRYLIWLDEVHAAPPNDLCREALLSCEEKSWLDSDNHFLVNEALGAISRCMGAVACKLKGKIPHVSKIADDTNGEVNYLVSRWNWGEFVSAAYQESIVGDFRVLSSAAGETDARTAFKMAKGVAEDLKIKADHCRKSTRGLGDEVDVYIKTIRGNKEQSGLIVYYKLGIYEFSKKSMRLSRFDKLSSPTHYKMPASRYLIWAGQPGDPEPPRNRQETLLVGEGKGKIEFDLVLQ